MTFLLLSLKYLIPRKKRLSVAIIGMLSMIVISLVVWLIVLFLSVTEGMERGWLGKLTTLHAPLRITPTNEYYSSYYYQKDVFSQEAGYQHLTISEKKERVATLIDPEEDEPTPYYFPKPDLDLDGNLKDPVRALYTALHDLGLTHQDFELSSALLKLQLLDPKTHKTSFLTQASYLTTPPDQSPNFQELLMPIKSSDFNHMIALTSHATNNSVQDRPQLAASAPQELTEKRLEEILQSVRSMTLRPKANTWQIQASALVEGAVFEAKADEQGILLTSIQPNAKVWRQGDQLWIKESHQEQTPLSLTTLLSIEATSLKGTPVANGLVQLTTHLQGKTLSAHSALSDFIVDDVSFTDKRLPSVNEEKETGIFLAKSFADGGVHVGDRGYLAYSMGTAGALQELRLPVFVAGFYDPGVLSIGNKAILAPRSVTQTINSSSNAQLINKTDSNGVLVWVDSLDQTLATKKKIERALDDAGMSKYWKVTPFTEYPFAKDLLGQFQSDKLLFMIVGILILMVGCCNIVSMGVLLVNDKKKEIGILQAVGASRGQILRLFAYCGGIIGLLSTCIGIGLAMLTLHNIDAIVSMLSNLVGREMFNPSFFGESLPSSLSHAALLFILVATPLISFIAALVPAMKACRLQPSDLLRSE